MTPEETSILASLDRIVHKPEIQSMLTPVVSRVLEQLVMKTSAVMAWEPIPLVAFGDGLPTIIRSTWIFILRAGVNTGAERHPNSHQRMMSFVGTGDMQTRPTLDAPWKSNILSSDPAKPLEQRWISIPKNEWHQPVVPDDQDWVVVSFHTVPAEELIEERPAKDDPSGTKQMHYVG